MSRTLERTTNGLCVRFERLIDRPAERVFRMLVDPRDLPRWFPATIDGEHVQGARWRFTFEDGARGALDGVVRLYDPPRTLEISMGQDIVRWSLTREGGRSRFVLTATLDEATHETHEGIDWGACLDALESALVEP